MERNRSADTLRPVFYPIDLLCFQAAVCQFVFEIVFHIVDFKVFRPESKESPAETGKRGKGVPPNPIVAAGIPSVIGAITVPAAGWLSFSFRDSRKTGSTVKT
jgi:hypothetical protein